MAAGVEGDARADGNDEGDLWPSIFFRSPLRAVLNDRGVKGNGPEAQVSPRTARSGENQQISIAHS